MAYKAGDSVKQALSSKDVKRMQAERGTSSRSVTPAPIGNVDIAAPAGGGGMAAAAPASLIPNLAGGIRSRNDAAADQSLVSLAARTGGDTSSPLFQMLATNAVTGAAGQTGADIAQLTYQASEAGAQRDLSRQMANQSARLQATSIANQLALGQANVGMGYAQLGQQAGQNDAALELQRAQLALQTNPRNPVGASVATNLGYGGAIPNRPDFSRYHIY